MRRHLAIAFLLMIVALVVGALAFVRSQAAADLLCSEVERRGARMVGGDLLVGKCEVDPIAVEIIFHQVLLDSSELGLSATADQLRLRLREIQALSTDVTVQELVVVRPRVQMKWDVSRPGESAPCRSPDLPIDILSASVRDGRIEVDFGELGSIRADGISADLRREGAEERFSVEVGAGEIRRGERTETVEAVELRGAWRSAAPQVQVDALSLQSGDLHLAVRGKVEDVCAPQPEASLVVSGSVDRLLQVLGVASEADPAVGRMVMTANVSGELTSPTVSGSLQVTEGVIAGYTLGNAEVEGRVTDGKAEIQRLASDALGGEVALTGTVALEEGLDADLMVSGSDASLERLVHALGLPGAWVDGAMTGTARLAGPLLPLRLEGRARVDVRAFEVLDRPVVRGPSAPEERFLELPPARVEGTLVVTPEAIELGSARVSLPGSAVSLTGTLPLDNETSVDIKGRLEHVDLTGDLPIITGLPYAGELTGPFTMRGPYHDLRISGRVQSRGLSVDGLQAGVVIGQITYEDLNITVEDAHGQRGRTSYSLDRFQLRLGEEPRDFDIAVTVEEGRVEDVVDALHDFHPLAREFVGATGQGKGTVVVRGPLERLDLDVDATARDGVLYGQPYSRLRMKGQLVGRKRFQLDEVVAEVEDDGRLRARGWADIDGPLAISLSARDLPVSELAALQELGVAGRLSGDVVVEGVWSSPEAAGGLSLAETHVRGVPIPASRVSAQLERGWLRLEGDLAGELVRGEVRVAVEAPHPFEARVQVDEPQLHRWIPEDVVTARKLAAWTGSGAAQVELQGTRLELASTSGRIDVERLEARREALRLGLRTPVRVSLRSGAVALDGAVLEGPSSALTLSGVRRANGRLDATVEGRAELAMLEAFLPGIQRVAGDLTVEATIGGTFEHPVLVGSGRLRGASMGIEGAPIAISELGGPIAFSQNRIILDGLTGVAGRGRLDLTGEITLRNFLPEMIRMAASVHDVRVEPVDGLRSQLAGELFLDGKPDELYLTGELEVVRARYDRDLAVDQMIPWARRRVAELPPPDREPWVRMDVGVRSPGTLRIDNRDIDARFRADLRLTGDDVRPGLLGTVSALEGQAQFRGNEFEITHALVDFQDKNRVSASFDVHAEAEVRDYRVFVHAFGTPDEPRVVLTSEPELAESDLLTLLTLGMTARDAEGLEGGEAAFAVMDALFVASGLDREVQKFIPDNPILREPTLRLTSGYSRGTGQVEPRVAFESHLFTDSLKLRYSAPIGVPGQRASAEYRITETVSAQAEWDTESRETEIGNLGVDLKLRWELE